MLVMVMLLLLHTKMTLRGEGNKGAREGGGIREVVRCVRREAGTRVEERKPKRKK